MLTRIAVLFGMTLLSGTAALAQPLGDPDTASPGDRMIQQYLAQETARLHASFAADIESPEAWLQNRERYRQEYFHMLGLWPLPERTPLQATVTGTLDRGDYVVEKLHYQSRPQLYVTGNLYRPKAVAEGDRLPTVLYVCGHAGRGRNGNKTAYQSHGIWLAKHGYICLMLDTLQMGEIAAIHHGTYREERWWWHSRGYTSAGVECWNGTRGIDYLISRDDVDPDRIAVTGISGGGAATFWIAAADERVNVAIPVSGMADLPSYVPNRVINGHCDCMFLYNTYQWPWTRIASLIAPRPLFFMNSDQDAIFPMDANERVINRLERVYSLYGDGEHVDALVSIGGHAYRRDIRQASFRFLNTYLKGDPGEVTDSEVDLVTESREHPIDPEQLRVFETDDDLPADELNTTSDQHFVPMADVPLPEQNLFPAWKSHLLDGLREVSFGSIEERIPAGAVSKETGDGVLLQTESPIVIPLREASDQNSAQDVKHILLIVDSTDLAGAAGELLQAVQSDDDAVWICNPRGTLSTRWTTKNPPNYVERAHVLLGRTVDTGRTRDIVASARWLRDKYPSAKIAVGGAEANGVLAAYAALLESDIDEVIVAQPPASHMASDAPQFLNVLRVCDIPDVLGMLAPRSLTLVGGDAAVRERVSAIYSAAGARDSLSVE